MGSFAFRLSCYHQFGWTYQDIGDIPEPEAKLLAIFFEEQARKQLEDYRKLQDQPGGMETVEDTIGGDDDE